MGNTPSTGTQTKPRLLDQVRDKIRFIVLGRDICIISSSECKRMLLWDV